MSNKTVTIEKCDNGFVLRWSRPWISERENALGYPQNVLGYPRVPTPTDGTEVHTTVKKVLDSAKLHLS